MSAHLDQKTVCPFYTQQEGYRVYCEGFAKGNSMQVCFRNAALMKKHKDSFCNNIDNYQKCPLYPVIEKKYHSLEGKT